MEDRTSLESAARSVIAALRSAARMSRSGIPRSLVAAYRSEAAVRATGPSAGAARSTVGVSAPDATREEEIAKEVAKGEVSGPCLLWVANSKAVLWDPAYQELLQGVVTKGLRVPWDRVVQCGAEEFERCAVETGGLLICSGEPARAEVTRVLSSQGQRPNWHLGEVMALEEVVAAPGEEAVGREKRRLWQQLQEILTVAADVFQALRLGDCRS